MKKLFFAALLLCANAAIAQKFATKDGKISFYSSTPIENIEAVNNNIGAAIDAASGQMVWQMLIKGFKFENELMQEHFNEQYMESEKYPKAFFKGRIADIGSINFAKNGTYQVKAIGKLTIHGVTKDVAVPGTLTVDGSAVSIFSKFIVKTADYNIKIPTLVIKKVAEEIEVTVDAKLNQSK